MNTSLAKQGRHRARELAMQLLYSLSARPEQNIGECLEVFTSEQGVAAEESAEIKEYLRYLVNGVWGRRLEIDNIMRRVVTGWRPERMVAVDRVVLRMAIFEGFFDKTVPVAVAIAEALELASSFGTEDSAKFVNGVLGKLNRISEKKRPDWNNENDGDAAPASEISTDC